MRRASVSERISATRRPSLLVSIQMATAACGALIGDELGYVHGGPSPHVIRLVERTTTARDWPSGVALTPFGTAGQLSRLGLSAGSGHHTPRWSSNVLT